MQYHTEKKHTISGTSMYRIADNKIHEIWQSWDTSSLAEIMQNDPNFTSPHTFLEGIKNDPINFLGLQEYRKQVNSLSNRECECLQDLL